VNYAFWEEKQPMVFASRQKSFQNIGKNGEIRNDGLVKGRNFINFVIPAKAGMQLFPSRLGRDGPRLSPG
jgi:hypothetical protein